MREVVSEVVRLLGPSEASLTPSQFGVPQAATTAFVAGTHPPLQVCLRSFLYRSLREHDSLIRRFHFPGNCLPLCLPPLSRILQPTPLRLIVLPGRGNPFDRISDPTATHSMCYPKCFEVVCFIEKHNHPVRAWPSIFVFYSP